ncbi:MAG: caleosin family protein [Myxococcaceae bacterium]
MAPIKPSAPRAAPASKTASTDGKSLQSTLANKLSVADKSGDGRLSLHETYDLFHDVGFNPAWAAVSAIATQLTRGPQSNGMSPLELASTFVKHGPKAAERSFEIDIANVQKSILKGQSGNWDKNSGNADPKKAADFIKSVDDGSGRITLEAISKRVKQDAAASMDPKASGPKAELERKKRFAEAYSAWVQLMELEGQKGSDGKRYLTKEQVGWVFDGTLFNHLLAPHKDRQISVSRIVFELTKETVTA